MNLEDLLVDSDALDRALLATILKPFVFLEKGPGAIRFTQAGHRLNSRAKVVAYLLARKARRALGFPDEEAAAPREIEGETGIKGGTLRPILKALREEKIVAKGPRGYWVPNYALEPAKTILSAPLAAEEG